MNVSWGNFFLQRVYWICTSPKSYGGQGCRNQLKSLKKNNVMPHKKHAKLAMATAVVVK